MKDDQLMKVRSSRERVGKFAVSALPAAEEQCFLHFCEIILERSLEKNEF